MNPAAGGGRCRKLVGPALDVCAPVDVSLEVAETTAPGQATAIGSQCLRGGLSQIYCGWRRWNFVRNRQWSFSRRNRGAASTLAFLPLGTGNSFLRDFSDRGVEYAIEALLARTLPPLRRAAA